MVAVLSSNSAQFLRGTAVSFVREEAAPTPSAIVSSQDAVERATVRDEIDFSVMSVLELRSTVNPVVGRHKETTLLVEGLRRIDRTFSLDRDDFEQ